MDSTQTQPARMPVVFVGHGNPMNAIDQNLFTQNLKKLGEKLSLPKVILCVSAHWMTKGTWVTEMKAPKTIHDFHGFPKALFDVRYPAPGSPEAAAAVRALVTNPKVNSDFDQWGLDHGTWSVLLHMYPEANIPVIQLSLDLTQPGSYHYEIGLQLKKLREQGVLILGSGNIVHNLQKISWEPNAKPLDWAIEFDEWVKRQLMGGDFRQLTTGYDESIAGKLSVPTPEHYLPLLYVLGAVDKNDRLQFIHEEIQNGSISMRTFGFF